MDEPYNQPKLQLKCMMGTPKLQNFNYIGEVTWPQGFIDGEIPEGRPNLALWADAMLAWGHCFAGNKPPDKFGIAMQKIGDRLNCVPPTPENLRAYRDGFSETKSNNPL